MSTSIFMLNEECFDYSVERKLVGINCSIHKKGTDVKIFSDFKQDLTSSFPSIVRALNSLSSYDFILDGALVPHYKDKQLSQNKIKRYAKDINNGEEISDKGVKLYIWDMIYYKQPIQDLPLNDRILKMDSLRFNEPILMIDRRLIKKEKLKEAILWASKLEGSNGAIIKDLNESYHTDKNLFWRKFGKLIPLNVQVLKKIPKGNEHFNYLVGVPSNDSINPNFVKDNLLVLGHTFNTKLSFEEGDNIKVLVEDIWQHKRLEGINYSVYKPRVLGKAESDLSSVKRLEGEVLLRGIKINH